MCNIKKIIELLKGTMDNNLNIFSDLRIRSNSFKLHEDTLFFNDNEIGHNSSMNYDIRIDRAVFFATEYQLINTEPFLLRNQNTKIKLDISDDDEEEWRVSFFSKSNGLLLVLKTEDIVLLDWNYYYVPCHVYRED